MHMLFVAKCAIIIYIKSVISLERVIKMKMYEIGDVVVFGAEGLCRKKIRKRENQILCFETA